MRLPTPLPPVLGNTVLATWKGLLEMDESVRTVTQADDATPLDGLILCDCTGGAFTLTLPSSGSCPGKVLAVKKIDVSVNAATVDGYGSETIEGSTSYSLSSQWDGAVFQSIGAGGWILRST